MISKKNRYIRLSKTEQMQELSGNEIYLTKAETFRGLVRRGISNGQEIRKIFRGRKAL